VNSTSVPTVSSRHASSSSATRSTGADGPGPRGSEPDRMWPVAGGTKMSCPRWVENPDRPILDSNCRNTSIESARRRGAGFLRDLSTRSGRLKPNSGPFHEVGVAHSVVSQVERPERSYFGRGLQARLALGSFAYLPLPQASA